MLSEIDLVANAYIDRLAKEAASHDSVSAIQRRVVQAISEVITAVTAVAKRIGQGHRDSWQLSRPSVGR